MPLVRYDFEESVGYWVVLTARAFRKALDEELAPHGITLAQWQVVGWLATEGELSQADLAARMEVEPPTLKGILDRRGIVHSFSGHSSMFGLFFAPKPPHDYRAWKRSDYTFYDKMAYHLHDMGIICEPDSREPWFMCEAHDQSCLDDTLRAVEAAVDLTLEQVKGEASA